jgi:hypothetical protein
MQLGRRNMLLGTGVSLLCRDVFAKPAVVREEVVPDWGKRFYALPLVVSVPSWLRIEEDRVNAVIHFHGGQFLQEENLKTAKLNAIAVSINIGILADAYGEYARGKMKVLNHILEQTESVMQRVHPGVRLAKIALSAWSAGFAALRPMLEAEEGRKRVDAAFIADGMFAILSDLKQRIVYTEPLKGTFEFAQAATRSEKLFMVSHSAIPAENYASVGETVDVLLRTLALGKTPLVPLPKQPIYEAKKGLFAALGYPGFSKEAHAEQIKQMGETMYKPLRARWEPAKSL